MESKQGKFILIAAVLVLIGAGTTLYTVDQTQSAIVIQLGKPVGDIKGPGLHVKIPFVQNVLYFDRRLLEYDAAPAEILTQDKKNLVVDNYSRWRIVDPLKLYQSVRNIAGAQSRLDDIIYSEMRRELGLHTLSEVVSETRSRLMENVTENSNKKAADYGIEIVDVRIKRADLPKENEKHVFGRMRAEREREAKKYRSEGQEQSIKIKAEADKDREIILADARRKAQEIMGEGDAQATKIYAEAYSMDKEFFEFYRSIEAYRRALPADLKLVLTPNSEFLKYMKGQP